MADFDVDQADESLSICVSATKKISKRSLEESFGIEPSSVQCKWISTKSVGVSGYWNYECKFSLKLSTDKFFFVVDRFCKLGEDDACIDAAPLLQDISDIIESDHKYLKTDYLSLGTWSGLSNFYERFKSEPPNKNAYYRLSRIQTSFFHYRKFLEIYFYIRISGEKRNDVFKLKVEYDNITKIVVKRELRHREAFCDAAERKDPMEVYLHLKSFEVYRWQNEELDAYEEFFDGPWCRTTEFGVQSTDTYCTAFSQFSVLMLKLSIGEEDASSAIYSLFRARNVPIVFANVKKLDIPKSVGMVVCEKTTPDIQYALSCLQAASPELYIKMRTENRQETQNLISKLSVEDPKSLLTALYEIYHALDDAPIIDFQKAIESSYDMVKAGTNGRSLICKDMLPDNLCLIKKAVISPSSVRYEPPVVVRVSALLRNCDPDNVMLVDIRDDDGSRLNLQNRLEAESILKKAVFQKMKKGLTVGKKTYYFFGSPKDYAEDSSFFAYAASNKTKGDLTDVYESLDVRGSLTEKQKILDLVLCESLQVISLDESWSVVDSTEDDPFKRGIGTISEKGIRSIAENLSVNPNHASCLRVVHGGRAGILVLDPELDGKKIVYRSTQRKYDSKDDRLYVIGINELKPAVVDKTFLSTLSSKRDGLRDLFSGKEFIKELDENIVRSLDVFQNPKTGTVYNNLPAFLTGSSLKQETCALYDWPHDELYRQTMRCSQLKRFKDLKELSLQLSSSYDLMPVVDEMGVLDEGEVFIQLVNADGTVEVVSDDVVLARRDALHPFELVKYKAISASKSRKVYAHLKNCVVLPSRGEVPPLARFASEADYSLTDNLIVIANPKFQFRNNDDIPTAQIFAKNPLDPNSRLDEQFIEYVSYLSHNNFEETYCALCDTLPSHSYSESCAKVCILRRKLNDFRLGGPGLEFLPPVRRYPDFMRKISHSKTYSSLRPLAQLFRRMRLVDTEDLDRTDIERDSLVLQPELQIDGYENHSKSAQKDLSIFTKNLKAISSLYGVTPHEALSGAIFSIPASRYSQSRLSSLENTLRILIKHLMLLSARQFKRAGMKKASDEDRLRKVSAYAVCSRVLPDEGGYAFCWMIPDLMAKLIHYAQPKIDVVPIDTLLRSTLLKKIEPKTSFKDGILSAVASIVSKWARNSRNKQMYTTSRDDSEYVSDLLGAFLQRAFDKVWDMFVNAAGDQGPKYVIQNLEPFVAEILRNLYLECASVEVKDYSRTQMINFGIQALIANTLVHATMQSSLKPLVKVRKIISSKVVNRRLLFVIGNEDSKYLHASQNNLQAYEQMLADNSGCKKVFVRLKARSEGSGEDFEEITAEGEWYAVENLETQMMIPEFRKIIAIHFGSQNRFHHNFDDE